jgi:hypothetical protein
MSTPRRDLEGARSDLSPPRSRPTICPNNCVSACPEPSRHVSRLRPDAPIYQGKWDVTGFGGTARDHSERSDNAEVCAVAYGAMD